MDRRSFVVGTTVSAAALWAEGAIAQDAYPSHAVTIINAFPPGGANDIVTRPLASALEQVLKQPQIERLLAGEEIVLTRVTMGRVLRTQQLAEFGGNSPVFKILGQVDAGLFRVLGAAGRCAFSFQL